MNIEQLDRNLIETEYPNLAGTAYFNVSSIALPPKRGLEAVEKYWRSLSDEFCENADAVHDAICREAREEIAKLISCSPSEIAFTKNTCDSITQFVQAYPFEAGDNVVTTSQEYPSNFYPWLLLERRGVEARVVDFTNGALEPEAVIAACDARTKAVALSSTFFCNGFRMDLKRLGELCCERGIVIVVDSTQSLGRLKLKPKELGIGFLGNGGHKCLLGMKGAGFLYCDEKLRPMLEPFTACRQSLVSWHRPPLERHSSDLRWRPDAGCFESGNPNYIGIMAMGKGVGLINELGIERIEAHVLHLEEMLRAALAEKKISIHERAPEHRSGIVFLTLPKGAEIAEARAALLRHKVHATVREGYIRVSIHFFNTERDIEQLVDALGEIF